MMAFLLTLMLDLNHAIMYMKNLDSYCLKKMMMVVVGVMIHLPLHLQNVLNHHDLPLHPILPLLFHLHCYHSVDYDYFHVNLIE
jgi:hypothetical protein